MKYKAVLFHPDGEYVTDFRCDTKDEVWCKINDMGSKWIFYPITFVVTEKVIIDTPSMELDFLARKHITTAQKYFREQWKERPTEIILGFEHGLPLEQI